MIKDIIDGVCTALNKEFGDGYEIYSEIVPQNLKEPCFFVQCESVSFKPYPNNRLHCSAPVSVQFLTGSELENNEKCVESIFKLQSALSVIDANGSPVRGVDISCLLMGETLKCSATYNFFVMSITEKDAMESLDFSDSLRKDKT